MRDNITKNMRDHITHNMSTCGVCQKTKETAKKVQITPRKEERAHQMFGNLIKSFKLQDNLYLDLDDPWSGILSAA